MSLNFVTKSKQNIFIPLINVRQVINKEGEYIRIIYNDNTEINIALNKTAYGFKVDHEVTKETINDLLMELRTKPHP